MFEKNVLSGNDFKILIKVVQINYASFWHLIKPIKCQNEALGKEFEI